VPAGQQLDQHLLQLLDVAGSQRLTERGHGGVEVHESPNDRGVPPTSGPALGGDPPRIRAGWSDARTGIVSTARAGPGPSGPVPPHILARPDVFAAALSELDVRPRPG